MDFRLRLIASFLALAICVQGITDEQKVIRKRRNVLKFPDIPSTLDQIQFQSQSQSQQQTEFICDPVCEQGTCVASNRCSCESGWSGPACNEFECTNVCVHGHCVGPNTCECNTGWGGESCEEAACATECLNGGTCSGPDTCTCKSGWEGSDCSSPVCKKPCQNGGNCIAPNTCMCTTGFEGTLCQIALPVKCKFPFEYNGNIYSTCTTVDATDGKAWCSTTTAFEGDWVTCDYNALCNAPGEFIEIPGDCFHYYTCTSDDTVLISSCPEGTLFNVISGGCDTPTNTPQCLFTCGKECLNGGFCVAQDTCKCAEGFSGAQCGIDSTAESSGGDSAISPPSLKGSGVCSVWGRENFYTFDGAFFASNGRCSYQLASDCENNLFAVTLHYDQNTESTTLKLTVSGTRTLELSQGGATWNSEIVSIPSVFDGIHIFKIPNTEHILVATQEGWIGWDGQDSYYLSLHNHKVWGGKVCGLCGNWNNDVSDDLIPKGDMKASDIQSLMNSWALEEDCNTAPSLDYCGYLNDKQLQDVVSTCTYVTNELSQSSFSSCSVSSSVLEESCMRELCQCSSGNYTACICDAVTQYSRLCVASGSNITEWRTPEFCAKPCPSNLIYMECGSSCPATCRNKNQNLMCSSQCVDGCFCPPGTVLDGEKCVRESECSCTHLGTAYASGTVRKEECEECKCQGGSWACDVIPCIGECAATGDPHYRTFDGLSYTFDGGCQYVLATDGCGSGNYSFVVIVENVKCGIDDAGTCTKAATLVLKNSLSETRYELKQGGVVSVGGSDLLLPYSHGEVNIKFLSSMLIQLKTSNGIELEWDGAMRLYVRLDPSWQDKVCGMCGNFNSKSGDDLKTPQNLIETNIGSFGNSWKTNPTCPDVDCGHQAVLPEACLVSHDKQNYATEACSVVKGDVFKACHSVVDWGTYYYNCRIDVCGCGEGKECMCESLSDYARACAAKGVTIEWRNATVCPVKCDEGMEYKECASFCSSTCRSIGDPSEVCDTACHPGCVCAEGLYLTEEGNCVEIQDCSCFYEGNMYFSGDTVDTGSYTCTCTNGVMQCDAKLQEETCKAPLVYIDCTKLPKGSSGLACESTCQNSQSFCNSQSEHCVSGCGCPEGTVKDEALGTCVKPEQCTCSSGGQTYQPGDVTMPDNCNTCTCTGGSWACTEKACPAECSSVGDPHYTTYDGMKYNFQGDCSYTLSEDFCGNETTGRFRVVIENIPCGNGEVTCAKSVTFYLYNHVIHLTKGEGKPVITESIQETGPKAPASLDYNIRKGSLYYIVETNIGVTLLWNRDNAAKIQLQPNYMTKVCGLCGNFDGDINNDLMLRGGNVAASPNEFGNDWKVMDSCPDAVSEPHPCETETERAPWAEKKCNLLNSEVFAPCHAKVNPNTYYENCLYDTCGCDFGGDCECFCTSVAVYAQACADAGVCINWRNNEVCPIMCESYNPGFGTGANETCEWKYEACGNPCPPTCRDRNPDCAWKRLEGCYVICKDDEVWDEDNNKCIPESSCPVITTTTPEIIETTATTTKPEQETTQTTTTPKTVPITTTTAPPTTTTPEQCQCLDNQGIAHWPGETWPLRGDEALCVDMTCVEETPGQCKTESTDKRVTCSDVNKPVCQNNYQAVQVQDGCSCRWECQCFCFGQGDPHFFTFDGYYYPFQGNCTFVLSRDMNEHHSNHPHEYEIWMENVACEEAPDTTCTRKMTVRYDSTHLVLYKNYTFTINGTSLHDSSALPKVVDGIHVELRGISLFYVTIPEIGLTLTYTGEDYSWSLSVPYSKYVDRTEGLCGVCNNDQTDDLTNRSGIVVNDIEDFGNSWLVYKESAICFKKPVECPTKTPAKECDIILSDVFESCHDIVDPLTFHEICKYDTAQCGNYTYCEALYGYARVCEHEGVCVNWRSDDVCPISCPSNRVYQACMPNCEQECSNFLSGNACETQEAVEGCFCPPDTVLVEGKCLDTAVCTNCEDMDGTIYQYGESWVPGDADCSICSCMEGQQILCTTKKCPAGTNQVPDCLPCHIAEVQRGSDPCCPTYECVCNYNLESILSSALTEGSGFESKIPECGPVHIPRCDQGYYPVRTNPKECIPEYDCQCNTTIHACPPEPICSELEHVVTTAGDCCPKHTCECRQCEEDTTVCSECQDRWTTIDYCGCEHYSCEAKGVCRYNGTDKQPGESWMTSPCDTCTCQASSTDKNDCYLAECYAMQCAVSCPPCSEYRPVPGQCCGICVQTGCEFMNSDGDSDCQPLGDSWQNFDDCNEYMCSQSANGSVGIVSNSINCPIYDIPICPTCYRPIMTTKDCCPVYDCVPDDVCCLEGPTIKVPSETWSPDTCTLCKCTGTVNQTTGFHQVNCNNIPCPSFDEEVCTSNGGQAVPTDDGCCLKCDNKCVDNNNNTYMFGETWYADNCTICSCAAGHEIVCNVVNCPKGHKNTMPTCDPCSVAVRRMTTDPCCPEYDCVCNYELGRGSTTCNSVEVPKCLPGYIPDQTNVGECIPEYDCVCNKSKSPCPEAPLCGELEILVKTDTECCPLFSCECRTCNEEAVSCSPCEQAIITYDACNCRHVTCENKDVCLSGGLLYNVGDKWYPDVCTQCTCIDDVDPSTSCHREACAVTDCFTDCPSCYEYVPVAGQCCGTCVKTGCPVTNGHGLTNCKSPGEIWSYTSNCTEYMCTPGPDGEIDIVNTNTFSCPTPVVPTCPACSRVVTYTKDCCPQFHCVQEDVCCNDGLGKMPGSTWSPNTCRNCYCGEEVNKTTGFHNEICYHVPCPPFDATACESSGGVVAATDDGCCMKCLISDCFECGRRISTKPEYMVIEECASTEPVSMSYCDGFCRGSYFASIFGSQSQCSCCNPTSTINRVMSLKCKNGTEVEYNYEDVMSCGCTATCNPLPPTVTPSPEAPVTTTTIPIKPTPEITTTTEVPEESGSGEITTTAPEAPVTTTTIPVKPTPEITTTTEAPEESGSGEITTTAPEAPVTTTTIPVKPTPEITTTTEAPEESGSGEVTVTIPEAPVTTTTIPIKPTPEITTTTETPEESGSGEVTTTAPEAPVTTTTAPPKPTPEITTTTEAPEESGSGEITTTAPEAPVTTTTIPVKPTPEITTTTEAPEESGSGEITTTAPEAPVTTTTAPPKPTPEITTTTEAPEESGSGEVTVTIPEAPVTTTTIPIKPTPEITTTTETPEESGSGEVTTTAPEAPVTTTTAPPKPTPEITTTTEAPEESGSGEVTVTIPEAPVTTTTIPIKPTPEITTTTETPEESGSGEVTTTAPEAPVTTTTAPPKPTPEITTTTEAPEESGSGEITTTAPEAPVTTTTIPIKPTPEITTTTEAPEESGSGEVTVTIPEAPVTTTTIPIKPTPEITTTTETPEESGSGEVTTTAPEAPVTTTTAPPKPTPEITTTTETPEESGSGEVTTTAPEAPVTTTTAPPKPTPEITTTTETPEESGSGEIPTTAPEAPVTTTTIPVKPTPEITTTTETPEESGSGEVTTTAPEAPVTTSTAPPKPTPEITTTTEAPEESGSGEITTTAPEAPVTTTTAPPKPTPEITTTTEAPEESGSGGEVTVTIPEAPATTTTIPIKPTPEITTTTETPEESGSGEVTTTAPEAPVTTTASTTKPTPSPTTTTASTTPLPCYWTEWTDSDTPKLPYRDDNETFAHLTELGYDVCPEPDDIECRPVGKSQADFESYQQWQQVSCDKETGLVCLGSEQTVHPVCEDYEIRLYCCPESHYQSQGNEAEQEVNSVEEQIQKIINGLQNGETPSGVHGQIQEQHQIMNELHHLDSQDQQIDGDLEDLLNKLNDGGLETGGEGDQIQAQHQAQHQIQILNDQMQQQSQLEHQAQQDVQQDIDTIIQNVNSVDDVHQSPGLEHAAYNVINHLSEKTSDEIKDDAAMQQDIENVIHHLMQDNNYQASNQLQSLQDETLNEMNNLQQNQNELLQQEQHELQQLEDLSSSDEFAALGDKVGSHVQSQEQEQQISL